MAARRRSITRLPLVGRLANRLGKIYAAKEGSNVRCWLQADLQSPEIDFRFAPNKRHFEAHAGLPGLTRSRHGEQLSILPARQLCAGPQYSALDMLRREG